MRSIKGSVGWALGLVVLLSISASGRTWSVSPISIGSPVYLGFYPTLALINGSQPVVCSYWNYTPPSQILQKTAFGWTNYQPSSPVGAFIAGDGGTKIVSNGAPVRYGQDGEFYSTGGGPFPAGGPVATRLENGVWTGLKVSVPDGAYFGACSADAAGKVYIANGYFAGSSGGILYTPPYVAVDLAVSPFGDVAVSGYTLGPGEQSTFVSWFDYVTGIWKTRTLTGIDPEVGCGRAGVAFDKKGNLGVAFVDGANGLHFDYLDMNQDLWTDELVGTVGSMPYAHGAALEFNRQDLPVIAAGSILAYDPVPEPASILLFGIIGLMSFRNGASHKNDRRGEGL